MAYFDFIRSSDEGFRAPQSAGSDAASQSTMRSTNDCEGGRVRGPYRSIGAHPVTAPGQLFGGRALGWLPDTKRNKDERMRRLG